MTQDATDLLRRINAEFEKSFSVCGFLAKSMGNVEDSMLASKRLYSYNPVSADVGKIFPQLENVTDILRRMTTEYEEKLKDESDNVEVWRFLGLCYLASGDFPNAFASYGKVVQLGPDSKDPMFWYTFGVVYAHYSYNEHALRSFSTVFELDPEFPYKQEVQFRMALLYRQSGKFDVALRLLDAIQDDPPAGLILEDIRFQIGYTYQLVGNRSTAKQIFEDLYRQFPNSLEVTVQYAWFLFIHAKTDSDLDIVEQIVNQGLRVHPKDPTLILILARIAMKHEDTSTAYEHYKFCISYCSDNPLFWCGLGILYYKNDQTQDAVTAFQRALYLRSELPEAWLNIGLIFEQQNDLTNAHTIYHAGQSKCANCVEFATRINALMTHQRMGARPIATHQLIDLDDMKFIPAPPEVFAEDYIAAVPNIPPSCLGITSHDLSVLSTYPRSFFAK